MNNRFYCRACHVPCDESFATEAERDAHELEWHEPREGESSFDAALRWLNRPPRITEVPFTGVPEEFKITEQQETEIADRLVQSKTPKVEFTPLSNLAKDDAKKVFFVTVLFDNDKVRRGGLQRSRTWGFFFNFEDAERSVLENWGDIYELGYYNLAVIEEMPEGICPCEDEATTRWYKVEYDGNKEGKHIVTPIDRPEKYKQVCNFSIG